jgi:glutamate 5-kinase
MSRVVVKLGSSIVADERGQVRVEVLAGICDQLALLRQGGTEVVVVTSGAIARGMGVMGIEIRPRGRGSCTRSTTNCCATAACRPRRCF